MDADSRTRARAVAARFGGAAPLRALREAGVLDDAVERAAQRGVVTRIGPGWYAPYPPPLAPLTLAAAARAYLRGLHVVTGLIALHALGLRWLPEARIAHLLVPDQVRRRSTELVRVTRCSAWPLADTWVAGGVTLAPPERAVVDAARAAPSLREARGLVLGAVADRWATPGELRTLLDTGQRNGSAFVRRAIRDAERGCASPPEAELVDALVGRGEPFLVNPELWRNGRLLGSPDIWLVRRRVGGEVESVERHGDDDTTESTYDRHERFAVDGVELVHLSVRRVRRDAGAAGAFLLDRARVCVAAPPDIEVRPRGPVLR